MVGCSWVVGAVVSFELVDGMNQRSDALDILLVFSATVVASRSVRVRSCILPYPGSFGMCLVWVGPPYLSEVGTVGSIGLGGP